MNVLHRTGSWRWLFRACLVALLLITSAKSGFAQRSSGKGEGEAPAEPRIVGIQGSAGASPSQNSDSRIASQTRANVPTAERQQQAAKLLEDTHNLRQLETIPQKQSAVKKLMELSRDKNLEPDDRYVVLVKVIPLAKETSDFASWLEAVNALIGGFDVDANKEKGRLLAEFVDASKSMTPLKPAVEAALVMARAAAQENRYADANSLLKVVESAVQRVTGTNNLKKEVAETRESIAAREKDWQAFQAASTKLGTNADDPAANFTVGRWHLLQQADWKSALPFLMKVSNAKWKAAAELEQAAPLDAQAQAAVGDAWWDIADKEPGAMKTALLVHAGEWYARAQPNLTSVLQKQRVTKRLDSIAPLKGAVAVKPVAPNVSSKTNKAPLTIKDEGKLPTGEWIDLLAMVKLPDHALFGKWRQDAGALICEPSGDARFMVPIALRGSYELNCEFTRRASGGTEQISVLMPVGPVSCSIILNGWNGAASGLHWIDGRSCKDLPDSTRAVIRPGKLMNGQRYRLQIEVVQDADRAAVTAALDGRRFVDWKGRVSQLSCEPYNGIACLHAVGILVDSSPTDIHKLELRIKQGSKGFRMGDDWQNPIAPVASAPPKAIADKCLTWKDRKYYITDKPMMLTDAQRLASLMNGRLLTISSAEEEAFILNEGRGLFLWMSGWRKVVDNDWRDERNRPLRFIGNWAPNQASGQVNLSIGTATGQARGWYDTDAWDGAVHACIEWGEEYPEAK